MILFSIAVGILPTIFWLWFWLKEDPHPEPKRILLLTFLYGMASTIPAILGEYITKIFVTGSLMYLFWAIIEETLKYYAAKKAALDKPFYDEPVDALVYLITAALGFACLENILFSFNDFLKTGILAGLLTGNVRFIGATLLHTASSAIVGASLAFSFFHKEKEHYNVIGGLLLASFLHFLFNYSIINLKGNIFKIFIPLWILIIVIFFVFEKIKRLKGNQ